jgi:hypothetical protein
MPDFGIGEEDVIRRVIDDFRNGCCIVGVEMSSPGGFSSRRRRNRFRGLLNKTKGGRLRMLKGAIYYSLED